MNLSGPPSSHSLIALPSLLSLMDVGATLAGQPAVYWEGDLTAATDANPLVLHALRFSPLLSIPASIAWIIMICLVMSYLPYVWRRRSYVFLCLTHLTLVWAWILRWNTVAGGLFLGFAMIVIYVMHRQLHADQIRHTSVDQSA